jgi:hypothetical protein
LIALFLLDFSPLLVHHLNIFDCAILLRSLEK